jgi:hypothetical protein
MEAPPPPAVEPGQSERRPRPIQDHHASPSSLTPAQQAAWRALDRRLAQARSQQDTHTLEAIADSLVDDCLWGRGLWAIAFLPVLSVVLLGLLGWWLALGLGSGARMPLLGGFLLLGTAFGQLLLASFLYYPQSVRLRQNLEQLEHHLGGPALRPANQELLQRRCRDLDQAAGLLQPPWRFPARVVELRRDLKQVVVDP